MKFPRELLADLFLLAAIGWVEFHLVTVAIAGRSLVVVEPNTPLAWFEIAFTGLVLVLGLERLHNDWRNRP